MKDIYIIGAGGFGREVAWLIERINEVNPDWTIRGFIDDNKALLGKYEDDYPIVGTCADLIELAKHNEVYVVCAVGSAKVRKLIIDKLSDSNIKFATLVDPSVILSNRVDIGEGTVICAGTIITVDVVIGSHVIINLNCTIGHDAEVCDFVTLYPSVNISGNVKVGICSELGTGMQVIQGKTIASNVIIGAGAVVIKDIMFEGTYVGIPAKKC